MKPSLSMPLGFFLSNSQVHSQPHKAALDSLTGAKGGGKPGATFLRERAGRTAASHEEPLSLAAVWEGSRQQAVGMGRRGCQSNNFSKRQERKEVKGWGRSCVFSAYERCMNSWEVI